MRDDAYRVLIVDDEPDNFEEAVEQLDDLLERGDLSMSHARSASEAQRQISEKFFDLILLDVFGERQRPMGQEVLALLSRLKMPIDVVLMTHIDGGSTLEDLPSIIARSHTPRIVDFIDKRRAPLLFMDVVGPRADQHSRNPVEILGLDFAAELLLRRRRRYRGSAYVGVELRNDADEVRVELDRLCRHLFGGLLSVERTTPATIRLSPLDRRGLSSSVVVRATVSLGMNVEAAPPAGFECVVKIGPRAEIEAEVRRYEEYVRFGVRLEERVELLQYADGGSLAGIVYSLAGGSFGELMSLDEALLSDPSLATMALEALFRSRNWYSVKVASQPPRQFFGSEYRVDYVKAAARSAELVRAVAEEHKFECGTVADGAVSVRIPGAADLLLPSPNLLGSGTFIRSRPWSLVHGDMHGGNVMIEADPAATGGLRRVSLIDYRYSGPGPRCLDAAALECAVRLADAEQLTRSGSMALSDGRVTDVLAEAANRVVDERRLADSFPSHGGSDSEPAWVAHSRTIRRGVTHVFDEPAVTSDEYLSTCLLYGLRQLRYEMPQVARIRIIAWVSAMATTLELSRR